MPGDSFPSEMYKLFPPRLCLSQGVIYYVLPLFSHKVSRDRQTYHTDLTVLQASPSSFEYCLSNWSNTTLHSCLASFPSDFAFSYDIRKRCWQHTVISHIYWHLTLTFNFLYISIYSWRLSYTHTINILWWPRTHTTPTPPRLSPRVSLPTSGPLKKIHSDQLGLWLRTRECGAIPHRELTLPRLQLATANS